MNAQNYSKLLLATQMIKVHEGVLQKDEIPGASIRFLSLDKSTHIERSIALVETADEQAIFVVFPGSNDREDWMTNFKFRFQGFFFNVAKATAQRVAEPFLSQAANEASLTQPHADKPGSERWKDQRVHRGFMDAYYTIAEKSLADMKEAMQEFPDAQVYGTAHSLGSAMLRFLFLDAQFKGFFEGRDAPILFTFGAPRMGNKAFVQSLNERLPNITRVVHGNDLVPRLPLKIFGYNHECEEYPIGIKRRWRLYYRDDINDHFLESYMSVLDKLSRQNIDD